MGMYYIQLFKLEVLFGGRFEVNLILFTAVPCHANMVMASAVLGWVVASLLVVSLLESQRMQGLLPYVCQTHTSLIPPLGKSKSI